MESFEKKAKSEKLAEVTGEALLLLLFLVLLYFVKTLHLLFRFVDQGAMFRRSQVILTISALRDLSHTRIFICS